MNNFFFLLIAGTLFSIKLFSQEAGNAIPCQEIMIKCYQGRESNFIIRNEIEYNTLLNERTPHPDCSSYQLPQIDFTKYTLIGIRTGVAGCKEPLNEYKIYYLSLINTYVFELKVTQQGLCERLNHVKIWCLIPKISEGAIVDFKITEKTIDE